jgi:hypothetical protein
MKITWRHGDIEITMKKWTSRDIHGEFYIDLEMYGYMEIPMKNFKYTWRYPWIRCEGVLGEFQGVRTRGIYEDIGVYYIFINTWK